MKVAILGAGGQLAYDLQRAMGQWDLVPFMHEDLDICHHQKVRRTLQELDPRIVINTAAYLEVDECEAEMKKAFQVNAFAVRNLAQICSDLGCTMVHISTDYVFDGNKESPYGEDDLPNPLNVYGASKLAGEYFVRNYTHRHFVIRTSGLYGLGGSSGRGGNFVESMINLAVQDQPIQVVGDQVLTPTYTRDLARVMVKLLSTKKYGLYHITNQGECSWFDFMEAIIEGIDRIPKVRNISSRELDRKARRPSYSVLDNEKLFSVIGEQLPHWSRALSNFLQERSKLKKMGPK